VPVAAVRDENLGGSERFSEELWHEHDVLGAQLDSVERAAHVVADLSAPLETRRAELDRAYTLLAEQIVPHLRKSRAYESALVRRDYTHPPDRPEHERAERLTSKLGGLRDRVATGRARGVPSEIGRILDQLHALARPHFDEPPPPPPGRR
jgi:hypothetical protein